MTTRLSTGMRDKMLGMKAIARNLVTGTGIAFVDGGAGNDSITDTGSGLASFTVGDLLIVSGSTSNDTAVGYEILSVAAGTIEVATASLTAEIAGDQVILAEAAGGSLIDLFEYCIIDLYSGSQPLTADTAESGTKLLRVTLSGGAFSPGTNTNGLNFDATASGVLSKDTSETWQGDGIVTGTAGWFRCYANDVTTGASTTAIRFDGSVGTSGAQLNMSNTAITVGVPSAVNSFDITFPAS